MAKLGGLSKFGFKLGGEPSHQEKAYLALRSMVGEGGSPPNDPLGETTIDGLWRRAKANALAVFASVDEAAVYQAFPSTVTDELPTYEKIIGQYLPAESPDELRRQELIPRWTNPFMGAYPELLANLLGDDTRFSYLFPPHENARYTYEGKLFDVPGAGDFDQSHDHTKFPNFADEHVVTVLLDVGPGVAPKGAIGQLKARADRKLNDALPAWNDFAVLLKVGIHLDISLLDVTGFSE